MPIATEAKELSNFYKQKITIDSEQLKQLKVLADDGYSFRTASDEELSEEAIGFTGELSEELSGFVEGLNEDVIGFAQNNAQVGVFTSGLKIYSSREMLDLFDSLIFPIDVDVVKVSSDINDIQNQVLDIGLEANQAGCGGTTPIIVYEDVLEYRGYTFGGENPFEPIEGPIEKETAGIGTYNTINQVAIGTYFGPIDQCIPLFEFPFPCNPQACQNYSDQIDELNDQIDSLRESRDILNESANILKEERLRYELQDYAYRQSITNLENEIAKSEFIINVLETY